MNWYDSFIQKEINVDYLNIDIFHLWHGSLKNRGYMSRHDAILNNDYDPISDINLVDNVYEWSSQKPNMHKEINDYFFRRQENNA